MLLQRLRCCFLVAAAFFCAQQLFAQASTGTIYGTVTDSSGAAVADARVVVVNTGTSQERPVTTNGSGQFTVPLLPVGHYRVRVEKTGFNPFVQENITLDADSSVQIPAILQVGTASQTVTVSANASLLQTEQTNLVQVVDQRRIEDLPLNGRNVLSLMAINAGTSLESTTEGPLVEINTFGSGSVGGGGTPYAVPISVNGSRANQTNYLLDNEDNNESFENLNEPFPDPDAVQEFTMQTSTFDAQYGRGSGGVVNVVTNSGTNELHGTAFDFLRNYDMNAANYFTGLDAIKRNQFGASIGGPVYIPHLYHGKNKTFFFFSYQGTRQTAAVPAQRFCCAPSAAEEQGNFSSFVQPNGTGIIYDPLTHQPFPGNIIPESRWDPTSKALLAYLPVANLPNGFYQFSTPAVTVNDNQVLARVDENISDTQRLMIRYFYLGEFRSWGEIPNNLYYINAGQSGPAQSAALDHTWTISPRLVNEFGLAYHMENPSAVPPPGQLSYTKLGAYGVISPGDPSIILGINDVSGFLWNSIGYTAPQSNYQISDDVSFTSGKHTLKFGFEARKFRMALASYYLSGGNAQFSGGLTSLPGKSNAANAFGEFLLGDLSSWLQQSYWTETLYQWYYAAYAQDDIRLTPKLTLNLGLRWDPQLGYTEKNNKILTFIPGQQSTLYPNAPLGILYAGDPQVGDQVIPNNWKNFAPRVGLAYQVTPKTVVRAAFGIFYDRMVMGENNRAASGAPFVSQATCAPCPGPLSNPLGGPTPFDPVPVTLSSSYVFPAYTGWGDVPAHNSVTPYVESWNFTVEHQLAANLLLRASYAGNESHHLYDGQDINLPVYIPGASTVANENQRRPYQPIGQLNLDNSIGNANYNALQVVAEQRYSHGFTLNSNFTWSKSIDTQSTQAQVCPWNLNACRGPSDFDVEYRFLLSGVIQHPELRNWNWFAREVLGGWQSNLIFTAQSGAPFTVWCPDDNSLSGVGNDNGVGDFCDRVSGVPVYPSTQTLTQWFNPAAFQPNAVGTFGDEGRNTLRNPGWWNLDYSLFKNFAITERAKIQLRGEAFNVFNHPTFSFGPNVSLFSAPGIFSYARDPRILQVAAKIIF